VKLERKALSMAAFYGWIGSKEVGQIGASHMRLE
jgi:hypothetical protein